MTKDGQSTPTANITIGGFRLTNVGGATALTDAPQVSQIQNVSFNALTSVSGATTIAGSATPTPSAYKEGQRFSFTAVGANGASPTLNVSSIGAALVFWNNATCTASTWKDGDRIEVTYLSTSASTASATGFHVVGHTGFIPQSLLQLQTITPTQFGNVTKNFVLAGPTTASASAPAFRALVAQDVVGLTGFDLLSTGTCSATATLDIVMTGFTAYRNKVLVVNLLPSTDGVDLRLRVSTDGGATYDSGVSDYEWSVSGSLGSTASDEGSTAAAFIQISANISAANPIGNASFEGCSFVIYLLDTINTARRPLVSWKGCHIASDAASRLVRSDGAGMRGAAQDTDAIRLLTSSGNIALATWSLYGSNGS